MSSTVLDILIHDATVLTVDENDHLYCNGTVVVDDRKIETGRPSDRWHSHSQARQPQYCSVALPASGAPALDPSSRRPIYNSTPESADGEGWGKLFAVIGPGAGTGAERRSRQLRPPGCRTVRVRADPTRVVRPRGSGGRTTTRVLSLSDKKTEHSKLYNTSNNNIFLARSGPGAIAVESGSRTTVAPPGCRSGDCADADPKHP